jgi:GAF domain-containing protein
VVATGTPLIVPDVNTDPHYVPVGRARTQSELSVPIVVNGRVIGVVDVESDQSNHFDEMDLELMMSLANQAGVAIENTLYKNVKRWRRLRAQRLARGCDPSKSLHGITQLPDRLRSPSCGKLRTGGQAAG